MSRRKKLYLWITAGLFADVAFATLLIVPSVDPELSSLLWIMLVVGFVGIIPTLPFLIRALLFSVIQPPNLLNKNFFIVEALIGSFLYAVLWFDVPHDWLFPPPYLLWAMGAAISFVAYWLCGKASIRLFSNAAWIRFSIIAVLTVLCFTVWIRVFYSSELVDILTYTGIFVVASMILRLILFILHFYVKSQSKVKVNPASKDEEKWCT